MVKRLHPVSLRLAKAREEMGLSLQDVADAVDVTKQTVLHWETGHSSPRVWDVPALCKVLGCDARWLIFGQAKT